MSAPTASSVQSSPVLTLVGAGLQNTLIALAALQQNSRLRLTLIERDQHFGGNHTWCFHEGDVAAEDLSWLQPLIVRRWPAYDVRFPRMERRIAQSYSSISSEGLNRVLSEKLAASPNVRIVRGNVTAIADGCVHFADGSSVEAPFVIDARGPVGEPGTARHFQKFIGLEFEVEPGCAPEQPLLMDATVEQIDGFRFVYVLPISPRRVLVEDTYYSDDAALDDQALRARILQYAERFGLRIVGVAREERGVLPLPTKTEPYRSTPGVLHAGYAGGFFHPTTGYSFAPALRLARHVARTWPRPLCDARFEALVSEHQRQARYCVWLNRLLFGAFEPVHRFEVLQRFYRLPADTIRRFYALELTTADRARIVCGRPPRGFSALRLLQSRGAQA